MIRINGKEYEIDADDRQSILQIINQLPVSFHSNCEYGKCGSCGAIINGKPNLMCKELVGNRQEIKLEPLTIFPHIRDLLVDFNFDLLRQDALPKFDFDYKEMQQLRRCIECFLCLEVCPAFKSFRDKIPISMILNKQLVRKSISQSIQSHLFNCTSCNSCSEVCPQEIEIFEKVVRRLRGLAPIEAHPSHLKLRKRVEKTGRSMSKEIDDTLLGKKFEVEKPIDNLILFLGCFGTLKKRFQELNRRYIEFLNQLGYSVIIPREQICCGSPLSKIGFEDLFQKLVDWNSQVFFVHQRLYDAEIITSLCPGCVSALKSQYHLKEIRNFADFLEEEIEIPKGTYYHQPCHDESRLAEKFNLKENVLCCGAGGGSRSFDPEVSRQIGSLAVDRLSEGERVMTTCPFCITQLETMLSIPVFHPLERFNKKERYIN